MSAVQCRGCGKIGYQSKAEAGAAAARIQRRRPSSLRTYRGKCGLWHHCTGTRERPAGQTTPGMRNRKLSRRRFTGGKKYDGRLWPKGL